MPTVHVPALSLLHALILGFIQGATEFLPVSSTAHMRIIPALLGWVDPGTAFSAIVQLGPIVAIIAYFRKDLARYVAGIMRSFKKGYIFPKGDVDARLGWYTVFGTIPLAIFGLLLEHKIKSEYRNLYFVAGALIILAVILLIAEIIGRKKRELEDLTLREAMIIGLAQALAIVPGASRSGTTITAGLFLGLNREAAARFSFLLSIPAITLAGLYEFYKDVIKTHAAIHHVVVPFLAATVFAGVIAWLVVNWLLKYLENDKNTTIPFVVYRILLGVALLYLVHTGFVVPESK